MKNLATCKPSEFLKQCNRVRKNVEKWLTDTEIMEIRKRLPVIPEDATPEERKAAELKQANANINAMLDSILESHPDETLALLALCCFIEPEHADDNPVTDYLDAFSDMISNPSVLRFFTSLVRLGQMNF